MILLDTNVVSEFMKTNPDTRVMDWLNARAKIDFHLCTPVVAEIRYGIAQLPGADRYYARVLSLPFFASMNEDDVERVVHAMAKILDL